MMEAHKIIGKLYEATDQRIDTRFTLRCFHTDCPFELKNDIFLKYRSLSLKLYLKKKIRAHFRTSPKRTPDMPIKTLWEEIFIYFLIVVYNTDECLLILWIQYAHVVFYSIYSLSMWVCSRLPYFSSLDISKLYRMSQKMPFFQSWLQFLTRF